MKKYTIILAAFLMLSTALPAHAETLEEPQSAVSYAEEISEGLKAYRTDSSARAQRVSLHKLRALGQQPASRP